MAAPEELSVLGRTARAFELRAYLIAFLKGDYAKGFFRRVVSQAAAALLLIEAIFLAEHFTPVFKDAVRHEANLFDISLVLGLTSSEIFDLALAIAILIAAYATLMQMRENRELLVLFASGLGPYQLSVLILIAAVAGQVLGIAGSGVVDPVSRYVQRSILFHTELQSLKNGAAKGQFYYFPSYVAYANDRKYRRDVPPVVSGAPDAPVIDARPRDDLNDHFLFVYQQIAPHASRVVTAAKARLDGPDPDGKIILKLGDFTSHTFFDAHPLAAPNSAAAAAARPLRSGCLGCADSLSDVPHVSMRVRDMSELMMVDQLLPFGRRGSDIEERTIFEQIAAPREADARVPDARADDMRLLAERFARSLLSFLAPILALAAVCLTSRRTSWFVLPVACLALMSVDLLSEWVITAFAPMEPASALLSPLVLAVAVGALALAVIVGRQSDLVRPQLARS